MPLSNPPTGTAGMSTAGTEVGATAQDQKFTNAVTSDLAAKLKEQTSEPASPAAGYREIFARDGNYLAEKDDGGKVHALAWAGGDVAALLDEPVPAMWQHKAAATGNSYGAIRIEIGNGTLSSGTLAVTFQTAFKTILEVFLQDKTAANAMYPSALATSGFTANGTGADTFGWMAVGVD